MLRRIQSFVAACAILLMGGLASGDEEGFVPLFNGRDLSGWVIVNVAPSTFTIKEGIIVSWGCRPVSSGRRSSTRTSSWNSNGGT